MRPQSCVAKSLWAGALLTCLLLVAGSLWLLLHLVGDEMAVAMQAITVLFSVCWAINFVVLVVLLALAQIRQEDREQDSESDADTVR